jgi:isochorismate synthase
MQIDQYDSTKKIIPMNSKEFFTSVEKHFKQGLPFVLYVKPKSDNMIGLLQKDATLYNISNGMETGFVMSTFHGNESVFFPKDKQSVLQSKIDSPDEALDKSVTYNDHLGYDHFINLVNKAIHTIQKKGFQKVVLSRRIEHSHGHLNIFETFKKAILMYPTAFKYLMYHPEIGIWLGATPEQLVKLSQRKFETVSLAGTQIFQDINMHWEAKERDEQAIVTQYIKQSLFSMSSTLNVSDPCTIQAGNLAHIKTNINGILKPEFRLMDLVQALHPTPAVCGYPKREALDFILNNEGYDRKFYTGFLGEWHSDFENKTEDTSDLYVNLRCMEFQENSVVLYVGCGITDSSDAAKEYQETQHKLETMQKIIS